MEGPTPLDASRCEEGGQPVLIITGMHRSATSLMASLCQSAGLHIGDNLMPANTGNELGHFEDLDFYEFHKRALHANGCCQDGFVTNAAVAVPQALREEASHLIAARRSLGRPWGWKDPRTVLFLDFWREALPQARYLFMFRSPWEVVDSLYRRGVHEFLHTNPASALAIWSRYNSDIKNFVDHHPDRCVLIEASQLVRGSDAVLATVSRRLGIPLTGAAPLCREEAFTILRDSPREAFVREHAPEAVDLYEQLRNAGSCDVRQPTPPPPAPAPSSQTPFELGMRDWFLFHERARRIADYENALSDATRARDDLAARLAAETARVASLQQALETSTSSSDTLRNRLLHLESEVHCLRETSARLEQQRTSSLTLQREACAKVIELVNAYNALVHRQHDTVRTDLGLGVESLQCTLDGLRDQVVALTASLEDETTVSEIQDLPRLNVQDELADVRPPPGALETTVDQDVSATGRCEEGDASERSSSDPS